MDYLESSRCEDRSSIEEKLQCGQSIAIPGGHRLHNRPVAKSAALRETQ